MPVPFDLPKPLELPASLALLMIEASADMALQAHKAFRIAGSRRRPGGSTLRPSSQTPLWNELRAQLKPYLRAYGTQANLGRVLDLPRQRVNAFVTRGSEMPDAERTLQLLAWLMAAKRNRHPS